MPKQIRRALIIRDRGCAFPGCCRRPRQCHGHHVQHWAQGGRTSLDNLVLLCGEHHRLMHHGHWTVAIKNRMPVFDGGWAEAG
ncbi:HNH endonuclease signature motif containing protein [Kutzneria sp. 744]|uniref:HNH endonuclease signature motif containing protein n=1 Tax=Kutzneria sp. (strain 744) TaxID=345341 RepID=UPI002100689F|nr:HNH endonuclease signature motif containing protein [Kutzneria sp. 744]